MKRKLLSILLAAGTVSLLAGCGSANKNSEVETIVEVTEGDNSENQEDAENTEDVTEESKTEEVNEEKQETISEDYSEDYKKYFYTDKYYSHLRGHAEYAFNIEYLGNENNVYKYKGIMADGQGEDSRGARTFEATYEIKGDRVIETIKNNDYFNNHKNSVISEIPSHTIIKGKIEVGNSWTETVKIDGKEYTAETEIIEIYKDTFATQTRVVGYKVRDDEDYQEMRQYEYNRGLVFYSNNVCLESTSAYSFNYYIDKETLETIK